MRDLEKLNFVENHRLLALKGNIGIQLKFKVITFEGQNPDFDGFISPSRRAHFSI